ncbi:MAG TPA: ferrous iron transport protein A [Propionicimonas sp.]|jgi:ferrous iron transport protein A|uniref:FeoA family protein n=1 Tax=Propionicimonas sp. TaxID=1955623 RepID=UPI002F3E2F27
MYVGTDLGSAPLHTNLTLVEAPESSRQRLSSLGLRVGTPFTLIAKTAGGGRVALVTGSRIALGSSLLHQLRAEVR